MGNKELQALSGFLCGSRIHCICREAHRKWVEEKLLCQTSLLLWASVSHLLVECSLSFTELWKEVTLSVW